MYSSRETLSTKFKRDLGTEMARRRNALPVISEPTLDPEHIAGLLEEEPRRRHSTNSMPSPEDDHTGKNLLVEYPYPATERYKLSVVGDGECGKTSLLNALVKSDFDAEESISCIFDECVADVITEETRLELMLWEISGLDDYESIRREMYRDSAVILICFDIGHPPSLQSVVNKWVPEISDACPGVPYLLIGCKNDLRSDSALQYYLTVPGQEPEENDSVSRVKAVSVAQSIMARDYVECCAKTRWNVRNVFKSAAEAILHKDDEKVEETKSQSVLRKFSWFGRRSSGSDIADCHTVARSVSGNRRLSLFSTS